MGNLINEFKKSFYEGQVERDKADLRDLKFNRFGWKVVRKLTKSKKAEEMIGLYDQSIAEKEKTIKNGYKKIIEVTYNVKLEEKKEKPSEKD